MFQIKKIIEDKKFQTSLVICFFIAYFILGIFLIRDYGVSTDEPCEKATMYINLNYVLTKLGKEPMDVEALDTYLDKYYGVALQLPMAMFEIGDLPLPTIYFLRHMYTFSVCFLGYICFFLLCKKILKSNYIALIGSIMLMCYPRFFAEQFYNLKDMIFMAVFIISMWATEKLISSNFSKRWIVIFSIIVALTTNVRTFGIIFIMLVIGYIWCIYILQMFINKEWHENLSIKRAAGISIGIVAIFLIVFELSIPALWTNPIGGLWEVFVGFSNYVGGGNVVFMGEILENTEIPWYYIPVWILISVPIWYIGLLFIACLTSVKKFAEYIRANCIFEKIIEHKYLLWGGLLFFVPWFGMAIMRSTLYNGWRHCYFMLPPIVLVCLWGIRALCNSRKGKIFTSIIITGCLCVQCGWIIKNHPYEMVYFNSIGQEYAEYFDRDYWHLSEIYAWKYISEIDDSEEITVNTSGYQFFTHVLEKDEKRRVVISEDPTYYIETYRAIVGNYVEKEGYEEIYSIIIDDFKVASVFKKR